MIDDSKIAKISRVTKKVYICIPYTATKHLLQKYFVHVAYNTIYSNNFMLSLVRNDIYKIRKLPANIQSPSITLRNTRKELKIKIKSNHFERISPYIQIQL